MLAGGLVALAVALVAAWAVALAVGDSGPGPALLVPPAVGAVAAVLGQRYADRTSGLRGTAAALGVIVLVAAVLGVVWLL